MIVKQFLFHKKIKVPRIKDLGLGGRDVSSKCQCNFHVEIYHTRINLKSYFCLKAKP